MHGSMNIKFKVLILFYKSRRSQGTMNDDAYCLRNVVLTYQTTHSQGTANPEAEISVHLYEITVRQVTVKFQATASSETSTFLY
jgi:hypothetical protein